jgi:hypothetical protein
MRIIAGDMCASVLVAIHEELLKARKQTDTDERWFVARTLHFTPTPQALTEDEQSYITGFRWWTAEELVSTTERVFPPDLGACLTGLLRDGVPASPVDIGKGEHDRTIARL